MVAVRGGGRIGWIAIGCWAELVSSVQDVGGL